MRPTFLVFAVLGFTVYGQLVIKARVLVHNPQAGARGKVHYLALMFTDLWVLSALAAAVAAAIFWMLAIQRLEIGYAYPFIALSFVLVPVGSMLLFGESLPKLQWLALVLIITGVTLSAFAR
jgi:multidrug transporter EmrE-like cation transporter